MPETTARTLRPVPFPVRLLADPANARAMHTALWLYLVLRAAAAPESGRLHVKPEDLARLLEVEPATISSLLGRLRAHRFVETRRAHGQLEVRIVDWTPPPGSPEPRHVAGPRQPGPRGGHHAASGRDEPSGLAFEIADALGDLSNLARYEDLVETYPEPLVRRAFREARLVPRSRVRKSRGALFTYFLKNYGNNLHDDEDSDHYEP